MGCPGVVLEVSQSCAISTGHTCNFIGPSHCFSNSYNELSRHAISSTKAEKKPIVAHNELRLRIATASMQETAESHLTVVLVFSTIQF